VSFSETPGTSLFRSFRPAAEQVVTRAIVATYSLDLVAAVGLILSLGARSEAEFESTPVELVRAFEEMHGRLKILHQSGRVAAPRRHRGVLVLLDEMLMAIDADERVGSWHPKIVLARYVDDRGKYEWRFWIGSRNLTGSTDVDAGVLLVGTAGGKARVLPEISDLAAEMLGPAVWSDDELAELRASRWATPPGVRVKWLLWRMPGTLKSFVAKSRRSAGTNEIFAVSPFVNKTGLDAAFGGAPATLLTSRSEAGRIAPLPGIEMFIRGQPQPHAPVSEPVHGVGDEPDFIEPTSNGVHAKLLLRGSNGGAELMIGSANLTARGLLGPSGEAVAWLDISDAVLIEGLKHFVRDNRPFVAFEADAEAEALEAARRDLDLLLFRLLDAKFALDMRDAGLFVTTEDDIEPLLRAAVLEVEAFGMPSAGRMEWLPGRSEVRLSGRPPALKEQSTLVIMHLTSRGEPKVSKSWTQKLPLPSFDAGKRNLEALAAYVGGTRFRDWFRSAMEGVVGDDGGRWSDPPEDGEDKKRMVQIGDMFTLEVMLARWTRNPSKFEETVRRMIPLLESFRDVFEAMPEGDEKSRALADLEQVEPFLGSLMAGIKASKA
jgi:hypothetical protein